MTDDTSQDFPPPQDEKTLLSERYAELLEAIEILYIRDNLSGRLNFVKEWPEAASHIFCEDLMRYDREGTSDRDAWMEAQEAAEERRLEMLVLLETLEEQSVEQSALKIDFVEGLVKRFGRDMALLMYSEAIVDRFLPPPAPELEVDEEEGREDVAPTQADDGQGADSAPPPDIRERHSIAPAAAVDKPFVPPIVGGGESFISPVKQEDAAQPEKEVSEAVEKKPEGMTFVPSRKTEADEENDQG